MSTAPMPEVARDAELKEIYANPSNQLFYRLLARSCFVVFLAIVGAFLFPDGSSGYLQNLWVTLVGAALAAFVIDYLAGQRAIQQRKDELILQMGSSDNGLANEAVRLLRLKDWLKDGSLKGAKFRKANLHHAYLIEASLEETYFRKADLRKAKIGGATLTKAQLEKAKLGKADLMGAKLQEIIFVKAELMEADLTGAYLRGANLWGSDLYKANLSQTDLRSANLEEANLRESYISNARFDESTVLPDGSFWTIEADTKRFTDPTHAQFWTSKNPSSLTYRSQDQ
jgi:hypothetical protein